MRAIIVPADLAAIEAVPLTDRALPESTYALLSRAATTWPDRTATTVLPVAARWREPVRRTFADLLADVHRYANLLRELGVRRGDAVALMAPNCADLIPATLAARALAPGLDVVLVLRPTAATGEPAPLPAIDGLRVAYLAELASTMDHSVFGGEPPSATDLAALFHTGGTTGAPKLAAHTHSNEVADAWMIAANSLLGDDSVIFAALPLFHVNALVVTLLAPLFKGQQAVWSGPLGYRDLALYGEFWKIVEHYRIAAMSAVPTVYAVLAQCPVDADISSLHYALVGASPLPAAVRESFQWHTGITLVEGYGLTEATCTSARSFPDAPRPGTVGQRMPYQRVKVVRQGTGEELPAGETGVLAISGPTVFPGYVVGRDETGCVLRPRQTPRRLAGHRRPGPARCRRVRAPGRPGQGPHHPRRAQHRPGDDRGHPAGPPRVHRGQRGRPPRRALRRGARRVRDPHSRRHSD